MLAVFGAAAGGLLAGLLFAPKKGSETRSSLIEYLRKHCPHLYHTYRGE
jgi:gas vesicle protein